MVSDAIKANPLKPDVNHLQYNVCLKTSLITVTEKTCGLSQGERKNNATWWWNSKVDKSGMYIFQQIPRWGGGYFFKGEIIR